MDVATILGLLLAAGVMVGSVAMSGGRFGAFIDVPSILCVFGGMTASVLMSLPLRTALNGAKVARKLFVNRQNAAAGAIQQLVTLAEIARRDGLLALEARAGEIEDPFIALGIQMAVDGTRPEVIEDVMRTEIDAVATRHREGRLVFELLGKYAPAFGMIGTLLGLIMMLGNMGTNTGAIGTGMAVALITTLYGLVAANACLLPCADKLGFINRQELLAMEIVVRGILAIQSGDNPRIIEQKLSTFVPPAVRAVAREAA